MLNADDAVNGTPISGFDEQSSDGTAPRGPATPASPAIAAAGPTPTAPANYLEQSALIAASHAATASGASASAPNFSGFDEPPNSPAGSSGPAPATVGANGSGAEIPAAGGLAGDSSIDAALDDASAPIVPAPAGAGLIINLEFDTHALAAPQSFRDGMQAAVNILEAAISTPITVNIAVGFGEILGASLPNQNTSEADIDFNGNEGQGVGVTYANLRNLLATHATSADDVTSVNSLPNTNALQGQANFILGSAQAKALGVLQADNTALDGAVGIGANFTGNQLIAGALHEITHAMGRIVGGGGGGLAFDLFRFSSAGTRLFGSQSPPAPAAFFSIDGGNTKLADFGRNSDPSDFLNPPASNLTPNDPFDEIVGNFANLTPLDLQVMDVLGFTLAGSQQPQPPQQPPPEPPISPITVDTMPPADFNHDGASDAITLSTDGTLHILSTTNGAVAQVFNLGQVGTDLTFGAVGSFFGPSAASDFILRGPLGQLQLYQINNDQIASVIQEGSVGTDFQIVSVGDYFQSQTDALMMRSVNTGALQLYQMQNGHIVNAFALGGVGLDQQVVGQGNFFNNGTEDLLMQQQGTSLLTLYQVKNGQIVGFSSLGSIGGDEHVVGVGDFNGDGTTDALERQDNGTMRILEFHSGQVVGVSGSIGLEFQPAGVGDFFGTGTDDFLMRSGTVVEVYKIQNYQVAGATVYGTIDTTAQLAGAYFNHLV